MKLLRCDCGVLQWCGRDTARFLLYLVALVAFCIATTLAVLPGRAAAQSAVNCGALTHQPGTDPEVLVLTTATRLPQLCGRRAVEIQNLGPNPVYCALGYSSMARVGKARKIGAGESWVVDAGDTLPIYCIAATASQVSGAATIVSEVK